MMFLGVMDLYQAMLKIEKKCTLGIFFSMFHVVNVQIFVSVMFEACKWILIKKLNENGCMWWYTNHLYVMFLHYTHEVIVENMCMM